MTPAARTQSVIDILTDIFNNPKPADSITSFYFRNRRYIGSKDRSAISSTLFRIMRQYHRLGWWIEKAGMPIAPRTLALAEMLLNEETPVDPHEIFTGGRYTPDLLSKEEKELAKALEGKKLNHQHMPVRAKTECPEWAFDRLQKALGADFEREMDAMKSSAPMDLRVNLIKTDRDSALEILKEDGVNAHAGKISPLSIRVHGRPPISQHPLFKDGAIEIQDEGSQMVALVANAKPGEQVVDFCAGAGGKTLAMGASMNNKGRIVAMDVLGGRLNRAKERFRRAGLHNIETRELTSERDKYVKRHVGHFDLVLVDAPCTGTGTWRRDPDKRWRQLGPGIDSLVPLQKSILDSACRMVKPGGRLVYATCSLLPEENEDQVEEFLKDHPEFTVQSVDQMPGFPKTGKYLKLTPARHDTDGFFAALLVRKNEKPA